MSYTREDKDDGSYVITVKEGNKTDVYYFDKNATYANDQKGRDHNHVAFKDGKITMVRDDDGNKHNLDKNSDDNQCYITTAVVTAESIPLRMLIPLKEWRYNNLESFFVGRYLSQYYRQTARPTSEFVQNHRFVAWLLFLIVVRPSVYWADRKDSMLKSFMLFNLFLVGLTIAEILRPR